MKTTKTDEELKKVSNEAVEVKNTASDEKKKKKKKKYTVEELLANDDIELVDEFGRARKVKVKVHQSKLTKRENRMGYVFVAPYIIGTIAFLLYPMARTFWYMFCKVTIRNGSINAEPNDFANFPDAVFAYTAFVTDLTSLIGKMITYVPLIVVFALIMSLLLNLKIKGKGIFRTIFFIPVIVTSGPVMADLLGTSNSISAVDISVITAALQSMFPGFIADTLTTVFGNVLTILWYTGVQILIFLAAIQKIDTSLYEAAKIDGGSNWECFWKITLPTIKPMILLNAIYTTIFLCQDTNNNWIINHISNVIKGSVNGYGRGAVIAWILNVVVLIFVGIIALLFREKPDAYIKQMKKNKKLEKKAKKLVVKQAKRTARNAVKFEKALQREAKLKAKGKDLRGGREDV